MGCLGGNAGGSLADECCPEELAGWVERYDNRLGPRQRVGCGGATPIAYAGSSELTGRVFELDSQMAAKSFRLITISY